MGKEFYTEKDIEDLFKRGVTSMETSDNVVLTQLAYEKANSLGMKLVRNKPDNPPGAPMRPYISQKPPKAASVAAPAVCAPPSGRAGGGDLQERIRSAVVARLGTQVDANLLDVIIKRVLASTGVK
jgi:hypothetical protein